MNDFSPDMSVLMAERACHRLLVEYCLRVDARDFQGVADLFTDDAQMIWPDAEYRGRAAILGFFQAIPEEWQFHLNANARVEVTGSASATAVSCALVFRNGERNARGHPKLRAPYVVAEYRDQLVSVAGVWRIASRDTRFRAMA